MFAPRKQGEHKMKIQAKALLAGVFFLATTGAQATERTLINEETVPVDVTVGSFQCHDAIPDHGFGRVPARVSIQEKNVFDRTLRTKGLGSFYTQLPATVVCADLKADLAKIPSDLAVERKVYRIVEESWDKKTLISRLEGEHGLEIPVLVAGAKLVLHAKNDWLEENAPKDVALPRQLPQSITYTAHTYPRSGTEWVGLFCLASYPSGPANLLTLGGLSGYNSPWWGHSNVDGAGKAYPDAASCEVVRNELVTRFNAEDPDNWGTRLAVSRKLETVYRYILDNQAKRMCEEIELDTVTTEIVGIKLDGARAYPIRTVPLSECGFQ